MAGAYNGMPESVQDASRGVTGNLASVRAHQIYHALKGTWAVLVESSKPMYEIGALRSSLPLTTSSTAWAPEGVLEDKCCLLRWQRRMHTLGKYDYHPCVYCFAFTANSVRCMSLEIPEALLDARLLRHCRFADLDMSSSTG
jgi:hypothetical protein